ncbi:MAG: response regulator [Nitrospira sp.]|nr:response regulator [Nitrospira sp.]MBX3369304.1 response regulator [Nitrospira sp.]
MIRFQQKPNPIISGSIALSMATVLVADFYTPLGITVWVLYLVPLVLSYLTWSPMVPVAVGATVSLFTIVGLFISPPGIDPSLSLINRAMGIATAGALATFGYQFITSRLALRKEEWIRVGQAKLSERMLGEQSVITLADNVLHELTAYMDAQGGAIFVADGSKFQRVATHGVPDGTSLPESFQAGDGLLGQALHTKRPLVVHDLPEGYFTVGSALGRSAPRHLLIAPFGVDGLTNTVVELAFFHPVHQSDRELIDRVAESIAVAMRSAHYRSRLQELLEETQRQAEELQVQSEELRVANEELEEQSRALKESHGRLEQQQAELEQTNSQLEEQAQILETQKDELSEAAIISNAQKQQLERVSQYKSEFLANMSHEMRTPLNSTLILAKLLADNPQGNLTADQVKSASTIESAGHDLLTLIDDVLDLAKVEAGRIDITPGDVSLQRLLDTLHALFQPLAAQKQLQLRTTRAPGTPSSIQSDWQRLEQVLKNLLSNALKFTETGQVSLDISMLPDGRLAFAVQDTGVGIPPAQQNLIFEPFCQGDGTTSRKYGGTGLGLSISREFVRLLGGELHLASTPGEGSTFTLILPQTLTMVPPPAPRVTALSPTVTETIPQAAPHHHHTAAANLRTDDDRESLLPHRRVILIVEDDDSFARVLADLAHELNFQVLLSNMAAEAFTLASRYLPSAVILDIGLPDHSGLSVIDRLKSDIRTRHIPVHVVSGHDYEQAALSLGAVGYLLKPVQREQLVEAFRQFESRLTDKPRRVLIVEDDKTQRESLRLLLGSDEVETVGAESVAECLACLSERTFDCMVLDITLPDASGFSLLETLSREEHFAFPPVIVYTGRDLSADEEHRLRKYSHSIIIKGAKSPERLVDEVTLFLHQVVTALPPEQQRMLEKARKRNAVLEDRRVLIVEDDVRNIFALSAVLEPHGAKIEIARNGRECLTLLEQSKEREKRRIDLVLMDIMMPEMDGLTAMRAIREQPEWRKLPIIALTAKAMKNDQEQALAAGANDYMAKPLDVDQLLSLVRVWMPR